MKKQYIRFGYIPIDHLSKIHRSDAILGEEKGVSVWNCAFVNDVPFPLLPENASEDAMADYFYMLFGNKPVYLVEGTELEEKGSAGEPLLGKDICIINEYTDDYEYLKRIHNENETIKPEKVHILTEDEIKDASTKDDVFINVHKELETYCRLVADEQDRFIFETISPFLHSISNTIVPKRVLERALTTFCEEHKEEWNALMNEHGNCFVAEDEEDEE